MTRDEVRKIFAEATDEQVNALLDHNSRDIGKAKGDTAQLQADLKAAQDALSKANGTIAELEKAKGDTAALQKQIDDYKAADAARQQAEKEAAERAEIVKRMDAVLGERKFLHERMKDLIVDDFAKAIADKANTGKSDADVFEAITKDKGYFASQNPRLNLGGYGPMDDTDGLKAMRAAMGLPQETKT